MIISDLEHLDHFSPEADLDEFKIMGGLIFLAIEASAFAAARDTAITVALTETVAVKGAF